MKINSMKPRLVVPDPDEAIAFYNAALGTVVDERYVIDGLVVHAALSIGDLMFSLAAEVAEWGLLAPASSGGSSVLLTLEVDDARATAAQLIDHGANVLVPIEDRPYGRCEGRIEDPFGHLWIPTHELGTVDESTVDVNRIIADLTVADTATSIDFYSRLFGLDVAMDQGWVATLGAAGRPKRQLTLMTADATAPLNPQLSIDVDDLDAVWQRATESGAEIVYERTVEPWGLERFFVRDPDGNVVNVLSHASASTGT